MDYKQKNLNEFRFLKWSVYKNSKEIIKEIFETTSEFKPQFKYDLGSQINRAAISIVLNIAEGSGKHSDAELNRFFNISLGSINEVVAALDIAVSNDLITNKKFEELIKKLKNISHQLVGFKKQLDR